MSKYFLSVNVGNFKKFVEVSDDNFHEFFAELGEKYDNKVQVCHHEDYIIYEYYVTIGVYPVCIGRIFDF